MLREQVFSDRSDYPKSIDPEYAAQIAEHIEKKGFVDLDDPNAPKRKVPRTDAQLRELEGIEHAKAEKRAQAEHQAALARLNDGTAVLRQKKDRTPVLVTKPKVAKPAKKIARVVAVKKGPASHQLAKLRRDALIADLTAGKMIKMVSESEKSNTQKDYQKQRADLVYIKRNMDITLIRLNCLQTGESYFMIDNLTRHKRVKLSGNLIGPDREPFIKALSSGKLFEASNVTKGKKAGSASVANLAERHGMDIFSVISGRDLVGWVMPPNSDSTQ